MPVVCVSLVLPRRIKMFLCAFAKLLADLFSTDTETIGITYIYYS